MANVDYYVVEDTKGYILKMDKNAYENTHSQGRTTCYLVNTSEFFAKMKDIKERRPKSMKIRKAYIYKPDGTIWILNEVANGCTLHMGNSSKEVLFQYNNEKKKPNEIIPQDVWEEIN